MAVSRKAWRVPVAACGIFVLLAAMWGGLQRMGWNWPSIGVGVVAYHGALMVGGFLGTLLSLERAVALGRAWTYGAPASAALGGLCLIVGLPLAIGQSLLLLGSIVLVLIFITIFFRQRTLFIATMGLGAVAWGVGNALWLAGWPIPFLVPWWVGFLVLTIFGERLELSRFVRQLRGRNAGFVAAVAIFCVGIILSVHWLGLGWLVTGAGMLAMAAWLVIHDLARQTIRQSGLPRFAASCLLSGYFWISVSGALIFIYVLLLPMLHGAVHGWMTNAPAAGLAYDSILHAIFLGFVFAMIFGHAPIIFPAVLGVQMEYHPRFYAHLILLEISVILRITADVANWPTVREWAGLLAAIAIIVFLIQTITSISRPPKKPDLKPLPRTGRSISLGKITVSGNTPIDQ